LALGYNEDSNVEDRGKSAMKWWHGVVSLGLLGASFNMVAVQARNTVALQDGSLENGNLTRHFRYYAPANLPANAPVVILFHGGNQSMRKIFEERAGGTQAWLGLAEKHKFLLVVPNGVNAENKDTNGDKQHWNDCRQQGAAIDAVDDVNFTRKLIAWAKKSYKVDRTRVYATGASNGGMMSQRLGIELSDQVAAIASFIGNMPEQNECKAATRPIPIMMVNGTEDPIIPWAGGQVLGGETKVVSATATLKYWLRVNGLERDNPTTLRLPNLDRRDRSTVVIDRYEPKTGGAPVWFYKVEGGGHTMPSIQYEIPRFTQRQLVGNQNRDLEGAEAAWNFLSRQRLSK
jgi:polyhydroxybutyrate depolymerase